MHWAADGGTDGTGSILRQDYGGHIAQDGVLKRCGFPLAIERASDTTVCCVEKDFDKKAFMDRETV